MAFKKIRTQGKAYSSPEELFNDLRLREIPGLLAQQADALRLYRENYEKPDIAMQMPTGSGKTLVGLLVAEWQRRRHGRRALYLCPTKQLVEQVAAQARQYGISVCSFTGSHRDYAADAVTEYRGNEAIGVTTYSSLFNSNPFFSDANVLVLDDAHAAENYVIQRWQVSVSRSQHPALFESVVSELSEWLKPGDLARLRGEPSAVDSSWVDLIPLPVVKAAAAKLIPLFDAAFDGKNERFSWGAIREHLDVCHLFVSATELVLRPLLAPTFDQPAFSKADQRFYMSATLGGGGELERLWGRRRIHRMEISYSDDRSRQGVGRRFLLFPSLVFDAEDAWEETMSVIRGQDRVVVLTPNNKKASAVGKLLEEENFEVFSATSLGGQKDAFLRAPRAAAVLANRYDGIDFAGSDCRLMVLFGLPRTMSLYEQFLFSKMCAGVFLQDRLVTRLVQALGRCSRGATDYSAVVVLGTDPVNFLLRPETRSLLHEELQGEVLFGVEQSKAVTANELAENVETFLEQGDDWRAAEEGLLALRDGATMKDLPSSEALRAAAEPEVAVVEALWKEDFEEATRHVLSVLSCLSGDELKGYRSYWNYIAGCIAHLKGGGDAADYFRRAKGSAGGVRWLPRLVSYLSGDALGPAQGLVEAERATAAMLEQVEKMDYLFSGFGKANDRGVERSHLSVRGLLGKSDAANFENGLVELGRLLGFESSNSEEHGAPDPWWLSGGFCLVFEAHTDKKKGAESEVGLTKVRQAKSHPDWVRLNLPDGRALEIVPVLVSPARKLGQGAEPHVEGVYYWEMSEFREWATGHVLPVLKELWASHEPDSIEWRQAAMRRLSERQMTLETLSQMIREWPLARLVQNT